MKKKTTKIFMMQKGIYSVYVYYISTLIVKENKM